MKVSIHVSVIRGEIVVTFGQNIGWMSFTPTEARAAAEMLKKTADEAEKTDATKPAGVSIQ